MRAFVANRTRQDKILRDGIISVAWLIDSNRRHKNLPKLSQQLNPPRQAKGKERDRRQAEFDQLTREMGG